MRGCPCRRPLHLGHPHYPACLRHPRGAVGVAEDCLDHPGRRPGAHLRRENEAGERERKVREEQIGEGQEGGRRREQGTGNREEKAGRRRERGEAGKWQGMKMTRRGVKGQVLKEEEKRA